MGWRSVCIFPWLVLAAGCDSPPTALTLDSDVGSLDGPPGSVDAAYDATPVECEPPLEDCGGTCRDLTNDQDACGVCGHSCHGGTCVDGRCPLELLVEDSLVPGPMCFDDTYIYWGAGSFGLAGGAVRRAPKGGGASEELVALPGGPSQLACTQTHIYYTVPTGTPDDQRIGRFAKDGTGSDETILEHGGSNPFVLSRTGDVLYLGTSIGILSLPAEGGPFSTFAAAPQGAIDLAIDETSIYWSGWDSLFVARLESGSSDVLASGHQSLFYVAENATDVFFTDESQGVFRMPKDGGAEQQLTSQTRSFMLLASHDFVYTTTSDTEISDFWRIPVRGGDPLVAARIRHLRSIAIDGDWIYYSRWKNRYYPEQGGEIGRFAR